MSKITQSARDEHCQIRLPGCTDQRVVWCHANGSAAGKGIGMKAPDYLGSYGCWRCHDLYDRRLACRLPRVEVDLAFADGVFRSQRMLAEKGLLWVK